MNTAFSGNAGAASLAIQPGDHKIVAGGTIRQTSNPFDDFALARYDSGGMDYSFDPDTGADHIYVKRDGANDEVWINVAGAPSGTPTKTYPFTSLHSLTFNTGAGNDSLTVDNGGGQAPPALGGIFFNAGGDTDFFRAIGASSTDPGTVGATGTRFDFQFGTQDGNVKSFGTETLKFQTVAAAASDDLDDGTAPNVDVEANGTLTSGATQHFGTLSIASTGKLVMTSEGSRILELQSDTGNPLSVTSGGIVDLNDNDMRIVYGGTGGPYYTTIAGLVAAARNGGAWNQPGITSTAAKNHAQGVTMLGVMEGTDYRGIYGTSATFGGESVGTTEVLIKYTYYGDADFNGSVDFDDYVLTDGGFNDVTADPWVEGDFDLNNVTDFDDYVLLDLGFNYGGAALRGEPGERWAEIAQTWHFGLRGYKQYLIGEVYRRYGRLLTDEDFYPGGNGRGQDSGDSNKGVW